MKGFFKFFEARVLQGQDPALSRQESSAWPAARLVLPTPGMDPAGE